MTNQKCSCGKDYNADKYDMCYDCSMEKKGFTPCSCGKLKDPKYELCYECSMKLKDYQQCACGKGWYDREKYTQCYTCSQKVDGSDDTFFKF